MLRTAWLIALLCAPWSFAAAAFGQPAGAPAPLLPPSRTLPAPPPYALRAALLAPATGSEFAFAPSSGGTSAATGSFEQRREDPWLAFDKVQHLTFSFLWTLGGQYTLVNKAGWSERAALPVAVGVSAAAGLAKEYYDWRIGPTRYLSRRDLVADAAGILLATGLVLL